MITQDRFGRWTVVGTTAALVMVASVATLVWLGPGEAGVRAVIRLTARSSALLFSLTFAASAINRLWPGPRGRWLLRNRRYLGLSFAVSHAFHLAALIALAKLRADPWLLRESGLVRVLGGGFGYLLLAAMAATSFDGAVTWMGRRRWKLLHTFGMYVLAGIFLSGLLGVILGKGRLLSAGFRVLVLVALGLRVAAALKGRQAVAAAVAK
jgi:sulfoxide reductase heme-binding subunit YedZ